MDFAITDHRRAERRAIERARAARHTRRVRRLRVALPVVSGMFALVLVVAAVLPKVLPLAALSGLSLSAEGLVMNAPRLSGHLGEGRRYEVTAARAVQNLITPSRLSLQGLLAELDLGEDGRVTIAGNSAAYDTETEVLTLADGVTVDAADGSTARLSAATLDFKAGRMASEGAVAIDTPRGTIRAGALAVADGGALIRFTGGVAITINP